MDWDMDYNHSLCPFVVSRFPIYKNWLIEQIKSVLARPSTSICHHQIIEGPTDITFIPKVKGTDKLRLIWLVLLLVESYTKARVIKSSYQCVFLQSMYNQLIVTTHISRFEEYKILSSHDSLVIKSMKWFKWAPVESNTQNLWALMSVVALCPTP